LFLDHVHPTIEGNKLLAVAIVQEMTRQGIVSPVATWNDAAIAEISEQLENSLDEQTHAMALKNLSRVLMWAGKHEEAERLINRVVATTSEDGETHFHKATLLRRAGNSEAALFHYQEAARLSPWNAAVHQGFGVLLSELGRKAEARTKLETAIRLDPTRVEAHYDLGIVLESFRDYRKAEIAYRTVLKLDPSHADAHNNLGIIFAKRGDFAAATEQFTEALRIDPNHRNANANLTRARKAQSRRPNTKP
jgi:Flp pilus assembly protein TadD